MRQEVIGNRVSNPDPPGILWWMFTHVHPNQQRHSLKSSWQWSSPPVSYSEQQSFSQGTMPSTSIMISRSVPNLVAKAPRCWSAHDRDIDRDVHHDAGLGNSKLRTQACRSPAVIVIIAIKPATNQHDKTDLAKKTIESTHMRKRTLTSAALASFCRKLRYLASAGFMEFAGVGPPARDKKGIV